MSKVEKLVKQIDNAMPLPQVVQESLKICNDFDSDAYALGECVSKDPILAAKILQAANSSFFGFVSPVRDIDSAIVRLGMNKARNLILSLSLGKLFSDKSEVAGYSRLGVWQHSISIGLMNEMIVKNSTSPKVRKFAGEALLAGLVHDIGIILADQCSPKTFRQVPALAQSLKEPIFKVEKQVMGFNHCALGAAVLKKWRFPKSIIEATEDHHRPYEKMEGSLTKITALSEMLITIVDDSLDVGFADLIDFPQGDFSKLQQELGVFGNSYERIFQLFNEQIEEALYIFAV